MSAPLPIQRVPREGTGWIYVGSMPDGSTIWERGNRFRAISTLAPMELPQSGGLFGPTWHVSISRRGSRRPTDEEMHRLLGHFGMREAEEDNHMPGLARHYFLPVDPRYRGICECKSNETTVVEPDGFRWQREIRP